MHSPSSKCTRKFSNCSVCKNEPNKKETASIWIPATENTVHALSVIGARIF